MARSKTDPLLAPAVAKSLGRGLGLACVPASTTGTQELANRRSLARQWLSLINTESSLIILDSMIDKAHTVTVSPDYCQKLGVPPGRDCLGSTADQYPKAMSLALWPVARPGAADAGLSPRCRSRPCSVLSDRLAPLAISLHRLRSTSAGC